MKQVVPIAIKGLDLTGTNPNFDGLSFEETIQAGVNICRAIDRSPWWIGAWIESIERRFLPNPNDDDQTKRAKQRKYGIKYEAAGAATKLDNQTLRTCLCVYKAIDPSRRRNELSWSHHREVMALEPDDQDKWLQLAIDNGWSKSDLRQALRRANKAVIDEPSLDIGFAVNKWVNEFRRGLQTKLEALGPVEHWDSALRQAWKRDMRFVMEFYQRL